MGMAHHAVGNCLHREARQRSTLQQLQRKQPQRHWDLAHGAENPPVGVLLLTLPYLSEECGCVSAPDHQYI